MQLIFITTLRDTIENRVHRFRNMQHAQLYRLHMANGVAVCTSRRAQFPIGGGIWGFLGSGGAVAARFTDGYPSFGKRFSLGQIDVPVFHHHLQK